MQKPRRKALLVIRNLLTCTMCSMALVAVLSVPVQVFPSSRDVPIFSRSYKLPKQRELKFQRLVPEQSVTQELAPLRWSKAPRLFHKTSALDDLWNPPSNRDFLPCTEPSLNYSSPGKSRGYLLVHTNGGLNQMRAGICDMVAIARIINATLVIPELDKHSFWKDSS